MKNKRCPWSKCRYTCNCKTINQRIQGLKALAKECQKLAKKRTRSTLVLRPDNMGSSRDRVPYKGIRTEAEEHMMTTATKAADVHLGDYVHLTPKWYCLVVAQDITPDTVTFTCLYHDDTFRVEFGRNAVLLVARKGS